MVNATDNAVFYRAAGTVVGDRPSFEPGTGLLVQGGRITAVGTESDVRQAGIRTVDLGDACLVPGFVDAHTHITIRPGEGGQHEQLLQPPAWQATRGVANLRRTLCSGVTTARIMTEEHDIDVYFKAAVAAGEVAGPRLRIAGRGLSPPGGHGSAAGGVSGPDALREAVSVNAAKGADHIKIFTTGGVSSTGSSLNESNYDAAEIAAIVDAAKRHGLMVSAHAHGGPGVDLAVAGAVRSIEHGALLTEDNIRAMDKHHTWLVLTNTILFHPSGIEQGDAAEPAILNKVHQARASMTSVAERLRETGIPIALGTDSMHGLFGHEMEWLVAHGWSPAQALRAGTSGGAQLMGLTDVGVLEPGRRADFVALAGNPLEDITAVRHVRAVYVDGQLVADDDGCARPLPSIDSSHHQELS